MFLTLAILILHFFSLIVHCNPLLKRVDNAVNTYKIVDSRIAKVDLKNNTGIVGLDGNILCNVEKKLMHIQNVTDFFFFFKGLKIKSACMCSFTSSKNYNGIPNLYLHDYFDQGLKKKFQFINNNQPIFTNNLNYFFNIDLNHLLAENITDRISIHNNNKLLSMYSEQVIQSYIHSFDHINTCNIKPCPKCYHIITFMSSNTANMANQFYLGIN